MKTLSKLIEYFYIFYLVNSKGHNNYENDKKYIQTLKKTVIPI